MGRRDEYDDDEGFSSPRGELKRGGVPPGVWVLVAAVGLGGMIAGGVLTYALTVADRPGQAKPPEVVGTVPPDTAPARKLWTRDEFNKAVSRKSKPEVIAAVGRPDQTSQTKWGVDVWYYFNITIDPVTNKPDPFTTLRWEDESLPRMDHKMP